MSGNLSYWRDYFRGADCDIFEIIKHSIIIASLDYPQDFKSRRDYIAELLFTCKLTKCFGCDKVELSVPENDSDDDEGGKCKNGELEGSGSKESKVSNVSYEDAEALTDEIEEESQFIGEVLKIKEILDNHLDESDSVLYESLKRLEVMDLSVEFLKVTEIGKPVNGLKKHGSKQIRDLVRTLIEGWVGMLDAWMISVAANAENTSPESVKTSAVVQEEDLEEDDEEEGLPSPPLDEGAFFDHSIELSQIFDGMDDDGNPHNSGELNKNPATCRKPSVENKSMNEQQRKSKQHLTSNQIKDNKGGQSIGEVAMRLPSAKPNKSSNNGRPPKPSIEQKINDGMKFQQKLEKLRMQKMPLEAPEHRSPRNREQQPDKSTMKKKTLAPQREKLRSPDDLHVKMEATKRKLQERYQEAENAKRQRTVQVVDLKELPKQQEAFQNRQMKPGVPNHNRNRANGRR